MHPPLSLRAALSCGWCCLGVLAGCGALQSGPPAQRCSVEQGRPVMVFELFFGRGSGRATEVTDRAWEAFETEVISSILPNGYTLFDATGAWLNPASHHPVREPTKVLLAALPDTENARTAIARIRTAYQARFHQLVVGMIAMPACGSF